MKKVLLTNHFLENFTGSELAVYDLAREFLDLQCQVYIATFRYGYPIKTLFDDLDVHILDLNESIEETFDLIWAHHFTTLDTCLIDNKVLADKIVFSSLSPYMPLECPPLYVNDLTAVLVNSEENEKRLLAMGIPKKKIVVFPNPIGGEFFEKKRRSNNRELRRLAIVSNHIPDEVKHAVHILRKMQVLVDIYGVDGRAVHITPEVLSRYDAVVSIGRTVQYCLAMGIPIYCYDHFGGPGYVRENNKDKAAKYNFSGRCTNTRKSAEIIVEELIDTYKDILTEQNSLSDFASKKYRLSDHVQDVLQRENDETAALEGPELASVFYNIHFRQREYMKEIDKKYDDMQASMSWKLTSPLRTIKKFIREVSKTF